VFRGEDKDCYFHPLFQKDRNDLLPSLKRSSTKKGKKLKSSSVDDEEDDLNENTENFDDDPKPFKSESNPSDLQRQSLPYPINPTDDHKSARPLPESLVDIPPMTFSSSSTDQPTNLHPFLLPIPYHFYPTAAFSSAPPMFPGSLPFSTSSPSIPTEAGYKGFPNNLPSHAFLPAYSPWGYFPLQQQVGDNNHNNPQAGLIPLQTLPVSSTSFSYPTPSSASNDSSHNHQEAEEG
jgi:hypothetical protein